MEMQENSPIDDDDNEEDDVFHFESEHLALRGNQCYTNLLRTIAILQAQRIRVHQEIDELEMTQKLYLDNPQLLLNKLRHNQPIISDNYMTTATLPELPTLTGIMTSQDVSPQSVQLSTPTSSSASGKLNSQRLWTNEEQRHLEQLLVEHPPEEVEMRRFGKIAKALGNRTAQQVFSRVQKYFQKLHDAGMPVPGRIPKHRRPGLSKPKFNIRRSTFFPAQNISLQMPEDDYIMDELQAIKVEPKSEPEILEADSESELKRKQQLQVKLLTAIRDEKVLLNDGYNPDPLAAKCTDCQEATVMRGHWRCQSCYCSLNLCGDCLADQLIQERFEHISHEVVLDQEDN